jgi:hypothetical protein
MMMVDNVVALLRPQHDWYHVMADERANLLRLLLSQAFAFFLDLAHAYSDLGGTQAFDWDRLQNRLAHVSHGFLPEENEPAITVDNIEVAQFVYLMFNNQKVRDVIDTITSKAGADPRALHR